LQEIKKVGITELILTGHSLAGGAAQVAKVLVEGDYGSIIIQGYRSMQEI
jgi:hypothetical protein